MQRVEVPIAELLPLQEFVLQDAVDSYRRRLEAGEDLLPVSIVPLWDTDYRTDLIVADGHHRAVAHHQLGRLVVPGLLHTTDTDVYLSTAGALHDANTLAEVRDMRHHDAVYLRSVDIYDIRDVEVIPWGNPSRATK
jgi:hypothetical protein